MQELAKFWKDVWLWRISGGYLEVLWLCEELSVGYSQEMNGVGLGESNIYHKLVDFSIMEDLNRKVVIK